jgi:YjjG family noncanonical pyrimidine nucleotidase
VAEKVIPNYFMKKYKCIFFDLDHTLWDYETNSMHTLQELFVQYQLDSKGVKEFDQFFQQFRTVNLSLWDLFDAGKITSDIIRKERFKQILGAFNAYEEQLSEDLSRDYLNVCPTKCSLMPGAVETLEYLRENYGLTVVTNGFDEIQNIKMSSGNLHQYFDHVITSQKAGHRKPAREIFDYALKMNGANHYEAIMIGDNLITDIGGAKNASIDTVLFNPEQIAHEEDVHYEIIDLNELRQIL